MQLRNGILAPTNDLTAHNQYQCHDNEKLFDSHSFPVKLPRWRIQDIDTEDDWKRAELLFNTLTSK